MMVSVVMSSVTRVPETSFALSSLRRTPTTWRGPELFLMMKRSSSSWRSTSPISWPTLCSAVMSDSLWSYLRRASRSCSRFAVARASISRDARSAAV